mmetsp:Transcript_7303/g.17216  ORF Transcript_7303/g.17216 Transcript_7303/m.17216 type:complete len:472 (-) Transcript_7303:1351-2766(-)
MTTNGILQRKELALRQRFERDFLPKYGSLWRCIEQTRARDPQTPVKTCVDFVTAIEKKAPTTIRATSDLDQCDCECEPPVLENANDKENISSIRAEENSEKNESQVIHLIDDSDSEEETGFDTHPLIETKKVVEILTDSDDDAIDFPNPQLEPSRRPLPTSSSFIDEDSTGSDSSSGAEFEMNFSNLSDEESSVVEDLIESTKRLSVTGKENKRIFNEPKRKRIAMSKHAFKTKRESITQELFNEFNKKAFGGKLESVLVQWSTKLRTTAGLTRLRKSGQNMRPGVPLQRVATIELSTKVLDSQERLESTLLHEMVHAAAWILDNQCKPPHGKYFWKWARIAMRAVSGIEVTTTHSYEIEYKYAWACSKPGCSFLVKRQSRSVDVKKHCCGRCKGRLVEVDAKTAKTNRKEKKRAPPSGYNLFVKEQSKVVRKKLMNIQRGEGRVNPKVSQSDVMKECARLWREKKAEQNS